MRIIRLNDCSLHIERNPNGTWAAQLTWSGERMRTEIPASTPDPEAAALSWVGKTEVFCWLQKRAATLRKEADDIEQVLRLMSP